MAEKAVGSKKATSRRRSRTQVPEFDKLIHERMRLGIMSTLAINEKASFHELREALAASDGNLSVHARKLEEAGYLSCKKTFVGRVPKTEFMLTDKGHEALTNYLDHMESIINATRKS